LIDRATASELLLREFKYCRIVVPYEGKQHLADARRCGKEKVQVTLRKRRVGRRWRQIPRSWRTAWFTWIRYEDVTFIGPMMNMMWRETMARGELPADRIAELRSRGNAELFKSKQ